MEEKKEGWKKYLRRCSPLLHHFLSQSVSSLEWKSMVWNEEISELVYIKVREKTHPSSQGYIQGIQLLG